jgi:hypothetical protein
MEGKLRRSGRQARLTVDLCRPRRVPGGQNSSSMPGQRRRARAAPRRPKASRPTSPVSQSESEQEGDARPGGGWPRLGSAEAGNRARRTEFRDRDAQPASRGRHVSSADRASVLGAAPCCAVHGGRAPAIRSADGSRQRLRRFCLCLGGGPVLGALRVAARAPTARRLPTAGRPTSESTAALRS